jgi:hypothetical protein
VLIWIVIPSNEYMDKNRDQRPSKYSVQSVFNKTVLKQTGHYKIQRKTLSEKLALLYSKPKKLASSIDIRGIITLSISSVLFLIVLTNFSGGSRFSFHVSELQIVLPIIGFISLMIFIKVEKTCKVVAPVNPSNPDRSYYSSSSSQSHSYSRLPIVDLSPAQ